MCEQLDERVKALVTRPSEGDWPYLWIDATELNVREAGSIQSMTVIVAVAVNTESQLQVVGMKARPIEADKY